MSASGRAPRELGIFLGPFYSPKSLVSLGRDRPAGSGAFDVGTDFVRNIAKHRRPRRPGPLAAVCAAVCRPRVSRWARENTHRSRCVARNARKGIDGEHGIMLLYKCLCIAHIYIYVYTSVWNMTLINQYDTGQNTLGNCRVYAGLGVRATSLAVPAGRH